MDGRRRAGRATLAGRQLGEEVGDVGGARLQRIELVGGEVLAVLEQVGAVGVEGVAGEAALQLQVGEEVEDQALEAGFGRGRKGGTAGLTAIAMTRVLGGGLAQGTVRWRRGSCAAGRPGASWPPTRYPREQAARRERGGEEERVLLDGAAHRPRRQARGGVAREVGGRCAQAVAPAAAARRGGDPVRSPSGTGDLDRGRGAARAR